MPKVLSVRAGILRAGLPQLPLTTLNSVISASQLSGELFPGRGASPAALSLAIGAMNAAGAWFGAMPCCCGAGGLAAQVATPAPQVLSFDVKLHLLRRWVSPWHCVKLFCKGWAGEG